MLSKHRGIGSFGGLRGVGCHGSVSSSEAARHAFGTLRSVSLCKESPPVQCWIFSEGTYTTVVHHQVV